jgi:hypothetical protein
MAIFGTGPRRRRIRDDLRLPAVINPARSSDSEPCSTGSTIGTGNFVDCFKKVERDFVKFENIFSFFEKFDFRLYPSKKKTLCIKDIAIP